MASERDCTCSLVPSCIHGPCVSTSFLLTDAWPYVLFALELHASTCMLLKDGRTADSTSVALMHQLVNDVVVVVHKYATSLRSTTEDQVTIRLQLLQTGDQESKRPDFMQLLHGSLRLMPSIGRKSNAMLWLPFSRLRTPCDCRMRRWRQ